MYKIVYSKQITRHITNLKACGLDKKAKALVDILKCSPFQSPPLYEKLTGNLDGLYSRRINIKHRLVYQVVKDDTNEYEGIVRVISMWT